MAEAASNQVNQDGGYTGIAPAMFIDFVHGVADNAHVDRNRIIFGDHLGPQAWRHMDADADADAAMALAMAKILVRDYVA